MLFIIIVMFYNSKAHYYFLMKMSNSSYLFAFLNRKFCFNGWMLRLINFWLLREAQPSPASRLKFGYKMYIHVYYIYQWRLVTEKNWGGKEENQSTVSCYFILVNYLSLLSYIQWKLSNKTMTYKTSLKKTFYWMAKGCWH